MVAPSSDEASSAGGRERAREASGEAALAFGNAFVLGGSLIATWSVALVVRFLLPRWLGPETFGALSFSETFCATAFVVIGLGVDTYVLKEIPVRPEHASDFLGGVLLARALVACVLVAVLAFVLGATHRSPQVQRLVFAFGAAQFLVVTNATLAALLQAARRVRELAVVNVCSKVAWGLGVVGALAGRLPLEAVALALVLAELGRGVALGALVRRRLGLALRIDPRAVGLAVASSLPFYLNTVANTVYARVDVSMLAMLTSDVEVGWYGAASTFASLALLVSPVVSGVLLPLLARAARRSEEEHFGILRRTTEGVLLAAMPLALLLHLGADDWVRWVFGDAFAPASSALRLLAPMFVFTYVAMIEGACLILRGRAWSVTTVSLGGLAVNPALNSILVPAGARWWGRGGAGTGAAIALLTTEILVTCALVGLVGRRAFDRRSLRSLARALLVCAVVVAVDAALRALGPVRLVVDALVYFVLALVLGVVRPAEATAFARLARAHWKDHAAS